MRLILCLVAAAALQLPAAVFAQQITVAGWVESVDTANSTVTIRTLDNPRTIQVAPNAVVRVNGATVRLDQLPVNSQISIVADKDPNGVLRATQLTATTTTRQPAAAAPPGSLVTGTLVGMNIPANTITLRTPSGDQTISLGTAPIIGNGIRGSTYDLHVGQLIQVQRALPTGASSDYVTQLVRVLSSSPTGAARSGTTGTGAARTGATGAGTAAGAAGVRSSSSAATGPAGAGYVDRGTPTRYATYSAVRTRTRGYTATYRARRTRIYRRSRRTHYRTRYHRHRRRIRHRH